MKQRLLIPAGILLVSALLIAAAWISPAFADFYIDFIFPLLGSSLGRVTSMVPFSVGELLILLALFLITIALLLLLALPFLRTKASFMAICRPYFRFLSVLIPVVILIQTLGCFIQYHATPLERTLPGYGREYTIQDLTKLRDFTVHTCNELSLLVERDEEGVPLYPEDTSDAARTTLAALSKLYPRLGHYQVRPKPLLLSGFISQQHMQGYYFPFSMEANYNTVMQKTALPFTMCHELSHTHGYIYEDEANFLAFLACSQSEDIFIQYSGWLGILNYVDNDFYAAVSRTEYYSHEQVSETVRSDNLFLTDDAWDKVEETAVFSTETVHKAADAYVDTTLKLNGVSSGKLSYSHVVALLLDYYAPLL